MKLNHTSPLPYLLAFIGLVACVALGQTERRPGKIQPRAAAEKRVSTPSAVRKTTAAPTPEASPDAAPARSEGRVILVTVDGWHVRLTDRMPVWQEMAAAGSWTLDAEVPKGATTVISHAELYTGADQKVNGVVRDVHKGDMTTKSIHGTAGRWITPPLKVSHTLFTAVEAAGYKPIAAVQKGKLIALLRPNGDETGIISTGNDQRVIKTACDALGDPAARLVVLHFSVTDYAGHKYDWLSERQYEAAEKVDGHLRKLRACIADAEAAGGGIPTTLIVTTDHGGTPGTHSHGANDDDNRLVPWVAVGPGIKAGHEIKADIRLVDTVPTVLRIIGIPNSSIPTLSGVSADEIFVSP